MARNLTRAMVLIAALGLGSSAWARQDAAAIEKEQAALPLAVVVDGMNQALGEKAPEGLRLSAAQQKDLATQRAAFEKEVREFLKKGMSQTGDVKVPDRNAAIRKAMSGLSKDQSSILNKALHESATKRWHEKHSSTTKTAGGQTSTSTETSGESSHSASSQHSSNSNGEKHSDSKSDKHSDSKSDKHSDSKSDKHSDQKHSDSSKSSDSTKVNWSKLNAKEREDVLRGLLEEIPAKDRADLAKELKLSTNKDAK